MILYVDLVFRYTSNTAQAGLIGEGLSQGGWQGGLLSSISPSHSVNNHRVILPGAACLRGRSASWSGLLGGDIVFLVGT